MSTKKAVLTVAHHGRHAQSLRHVRAGSALRGRVADGQHRYQTASINLVVFVAMVAGPAAAQRPVPVVAVPQARQPTVVAAAAAPTSLRAGSTPTTIRLTWVCPQGATGYDVYATPTGGAPIKLTPSPITNPCYQDLSLQLKYDPRLPAPTQTTYSSSYTHVGLAPMAEFSYVVRALHQSGVGDSDPLTARTTLWPAPTGLAVALSARSATLTWKPVAGASGYLVFRQLHGQPSFQQITAAPVGGASFRDNGLPIGTHSYYLMAVNGDPSPSVSVLAGRPTNAGVATYRGKPTLDFRWDGTDDASSVSLSRAGSIAGPYAPVKQLSTAKNSWARDYDALVGVTQYYKIQAVYPALGTLESDVLTATIPPPPQGITNLKATSPGPNTAKLTWTCDPEATGYQLLHGKGLDPMDWIRGYGSTLPLVITQCEYTDTNLWNGASYRYSVVGRYPDPNTSTEAQVSVTITP